MNHATGALRIFQLGPARFEVVITDQLMPGMNGLELAKEVHKIRPNLAVILCTCFTEASTRQEAEAAGVHDFLPKPIMMRELADVVRTAIDRSRASDAV